LIVGLAPGDDAAVYLIDETQALVQTLDFFPPIVDDPYTFGAIAAANSMSDVYAMGGEVALALNIVAFPTDLDKAILTAILQGAVASMLKLNGPASRVFRWAGVRACTDITGFGLLGHASEMAEAGGVCFVIDASEVPALDGAMDYIRAKQIPGGLGRNREYLLAGNEPEAAHPTGLQATVRVHAAPSVPRDLLTLLFDPQTSGGLLATVPADRIAEV